MRVTLIHNPRAGAGDFDPEALMDVMRKHGHEPTYQCRKDKDWEKCLDEATDLFAVAGGDGSVARVARKLARLPSCHTPIAVLPMGTANNIANSLNIRGNAHNLIAGWNDAKRVPVDVGRAKTGKATDAFIESIGCGFFADMMVAEEAEPSVEGDTPDEAVASARKLLRRTLKKAKPRKWRVEVDGHDHSGSYLLVEAMNMKRIGPGLELAPDADLGDGLIEVVFVCDDESDRENLDAHLREHPADEPVPPLLKIRRGREIIIDAGKDILHLDDKPWNASGEIQLSLNKQNLTFLVP
jgi:diacylglycerol kinase family enzyme